MPAHPITKFVGGEISPKLAGRVDQPRIRHGLWRLENMLVMPQGGATRRSGSTYVAPVKTASKRVSLVPFIFSDEQAYLLEFGHEYIRVYKDRGQLVSVDSNTKLLLHMDGLEGSTDFEDDGYTGHTITSNYNAKVNTAHAKFGTGSLFLDRTLNSHLWLGDHSDWDMDTGLFTFDFWFEPRSLLIGSDHCFFSQAESADHYVYFGIYRQSVSMYWLKVYVYNTTAVQLSINSFIADWSPAGKQHYALIRGWGGDADAVAITVNGAFAAGALMVGTKHWPDLTTNLEIGRGSLSGSVKDMDGYLDEFRISKGVARWTSAFSPPTVEYPQAQGGTAYEIATSYSEAELPFLKFTQSADVLYIAHPDHAPAKLIREGHVDWTLETIDFQPPPVYEADYSPGYSLVLSGVSGTGVTCTAGTASFLPSDVDRQIRNPGEGGRAIITTFSSTTVVLADVIDAFSATGQDPDDWVLRNTPNTALTPSGKRVHSIVTLTGATGCFRSDDVGNYITINDGVVHLLEFTSATVVKGEVLHALTSTGSDTDWDLNVTMWTSDLGYPRAVGFHEERLCWGGTAFWKQSVWGSMTGDYENHTPGPNDADALDLPLSSGQINPIIWLLSAQAFLAGSGGSEWRIGSSGYLEPLTPSNVQAKEETFHGTANIAPVKAHNAILYVQRGGRILRELMFNEQGTGFIANDLSFIADHLTENATILDLAWQEEPPILWMVRSDGVLLGLVYDRANDGLVAWSRHITDGEFESVAVIPSTTGPDEVWVSVKRTIDDSDVRYVEYLADDFKDVLAKAWFVDSGLLYDGAPVSSVSGLAHLEGKTVKVLVDGAEHPDCTVASASIDLDFEGSTIIVGLPMESLLETTPLDVASEDSQATQALPKQISQLVVRFFRTVGALVGPNEDKLSVVPFRTPADLMDEALPLFSGDKKISWPGGWDDQPTIMVKADDNLPLTVLGIFAETDLRAEDD